MLQGPYPWLRAAKAPTMGLKMRIACLIPLVLLFGLLPTDSPQWALLGIVGRMGPTMVPSLPLQTVQLLGGSGFNCVPLLCTLQLASHCLHIRQTIRGFPLVSHCLLAPMPRALVHGKWLQFTLFLGLASCQRAPNTFSRLTAASALNQQLASVWLFLRFAAIVGYL